MYSDCAVVLIIARSNAHLSIVREYVQPVPPAEHIVVHDELQKSRPRREGPRGNILASCADKAGCASAIGGKLSSAVPMRVNLLVAR